MDQIDEIRMYNLKEVCKMLGPHANTIMKWSKEGKFPSPKKTGEKTYWWFGWQLREWIYQQPPTISHKQARQMSG
jgi:predicted DNA-binding transcriptional regulator AlpA